MPKAEGTSKMQFISHSSFQGIGPSRCMYDSTGGSWEPGLLPQNGGLQLLQLHSSQGPGERAWPLSTHDQAPKGPTSVLQCSLAASWAA